MSFRTNFLFLFFIILINIVVGCVGICVDACVGNFVGNGASAVDAYNASLLFNIITFINKITQYIY